MSDVVSIELLLDPDTEARVRSDWERLAAAGMSSLGAHRRESNRPHVTLLVRPSLSAAQWGEALALLPIAVRLTVPLVFEHGDRGVLAWRVEGGSALQRLHESVHRGAGAPGPSGDAPHTAPGEWTPHVTLARRLRLQSLPDALALLGDPVEGSGIALRRWDAASATVTPLS